LIEKTDIFKKLETKELKARDLVDDTLKNVDLLPEIINGISSKNPRVKFKSAEILRQISEKDPKILYSILIFLWIFLKARIESSNGKQWALLEI